MVVVSVVVVSVVGGVVAGMWVVIVAQARREALRGGESLGRLLLAITGTLAFAIIIRSAWKEWTADIHRKSDRNTNRKGDQTIFKAQENSYTKL